MEDNIEAQEVLPARDLGQERLISQVEEYLELCRRAKEFFSQHPTSISQERLEMLKTWQSIKREKGVNLQVFALGSLGWGQSSEESDLELGIIAERNTLPQVKVGSSSQREKLRQDLKRYLADQGITTDVQSRIIIFDEVDDPSVIVNFLIFSSSGTTLDGKTDSLVDKISFLLGGSWEKSRFR